MAKYAYAPLSVDERRRRPHDEVSNRENDDNLVNERMPMCVGVCVLLAIVYVLSRSGGVNVDPSVVGRMPESNLTIGQVPPVVNQPVFPTSTAGQAVVGSSIGSAESLRGSHDGSANPQEGSKCSCEGLVDPNTIDMGVLRQKALERTPPHIIECAKASAGESQSACHLPSATRYQAVKQKGATIWMTGCSGAGKTTIATALEDILVKHYGKHVYRLDGDNLRTGLNRDLTFTEADRAESVRRTGELASLFADSGVITLVGLISPYRHDRDMVRQRHLDQGIPYYEVFLDVPVAELQKRDPKGQYAKVQAGQLKHFTCIDDPYEEPIHPEITLKTHELTIEQSAAILFHRLHQDGILEGAPKLTPPGLPNPDGDELIDLHVPPILQEEKMKEAQTLPKVLITDIDLNWLQVIGEGWASPLKGFMREGTLLETLHFNSLMVDPFNLTGSANRHETQTDFEHFPERPPPQRVSMSVPITLAITDFTKTIIERSQAKKVALVTQMGQTVAILNSPEIYSNRKEEIISRMFGAMDPGHPYIQHILQGGPYLIGGEVELLDRIKYNDGLDQWRKTAKELMAEFQDKGADTVYAFQTRNPTHAGHAYLMRSAGEDLKRKGYKNPVLWLSPLGGWTKKDDVPLDVRIHQHEQVLNAGLTHPGGLDPKTTVMAIWPSPMVYAGPTEVQFHAKSRRTAGASYFVVGRDPAGLPRSDRDEDLYDGDHGRYVLQYSPGIGDMKMLSFVKVMYDITDNVMKEPDPNRVQDFISISGTKMRLLARNGATPCSPDHIPNDLVEANCIPSGFMVPKGWQNVVDYYRNLNETERWVPWSRPRIDPPKCSKTTPSGRFGAKSFQLKHNTYTSFWHDIPISPLDENELNIINFVTEIPMYMAAKMEVAKELPNNPIVQDTNDDGSARYFTYGVPFFNYGLVPQTWEDPSRKNTQGFGGDNDPLDVMEVGTKPLNMGSVTPCRVIGSFELIDQGETDYKILCISTKDELAKQIFTMEDLERFRPGYVEMMKNWMKRYKTSDGKKENVLTREEPSDGKEAMKIIEECHERWKQLCKGGGGGSSTGFSLYGSVTVEEKGEDHGFWLDSPACHG